MKPIELIKLWSDLQIFLNDTAASDEDKAMVAEEVRRSLPPIMVCTSSPQTYAVVEKLIKAELEKYRGNTRTTKAAKDPAKEVKAKVGTRKR